MKINSKIANSVQRLIKKQASEVKPNPQVASGTSLNSKIQEDDGLLERVALRSQHSSSSKPQLLVEEILKTVTGKTELSAVDQPIVQSLLNTIAEDHTLKEQVERILQDSVGLDSDQRMGE